MLSGWWPFTYMGIAGSDCEPLLLSPILRPTGNYGFGEGAASGARTEHGAIQAKTLGRMLFAGAALAGLAVRT